MQTKHHTILSLNCLRHLAINCSQRLDLDLDILLNAVGFFAVKTALKVSDGVECKSHYF